MEHLGRHPDVHVTRETKVFLNLCRSPSDADKVLSSEAAKDVYTYLLEALDITPPTGSLPDKEIGGPTTIRDVIRKSFEEASRQSDCAILIEKTPDHANFIDAIQSVFPRARYVHVVRDPRDVALSWRGLPWSPAGILWPAIKWRKTIRKLTAIPSLSDDVLFTLRYEAFLVNPEQVLAGLFRFLQLDESLIGRAPVGPVSFDARAEFWKRKAMGPVDAANRDKWRSNMPAAYQYLFDQMLAPELARAGYKQAGVSLGEAGWRNVMFTLGYECALIIRHLPVSLLRSAGLLKRSQPTRAR